MDHFEVISEREQIAARVIEKAGCIRVALLSACPDKGIFAHLARALVPLGP